MREFLNCAGDSVNGSTPRAGGADPFAGRGRQANVATVSTIVVVGDGHATTGATLLVIATVGVCRAGARRSGSRLVPQPKAGQRHPGQTDTEPFERLPPCD